MTSNSTSAKGGSTAVGRDNLGPVVNINAEDDAKVSVRIEQTVARQLPSYLGAVIVRFSQESLAEYGLGERKPMLPEVVEKINFNCFPQNHRVLRDYQRHVLILEKCYQGVEQQNADVRYLVRRKAGVVYEQALLTACPAGALSPTEKLKYVRENAAHLVNTVVNQLLKSFESSVTVTVAEETAHLAISLIVADAVIECEVLERPQDAVAS